jgi:hypothetical protein
MKPGGTLRITQQQGNRQKNRHKKYAHAPRPAQNTGKRGGAKQAPQTGTG